MMDKESAADPKCSNMEEMLDYFEERGEKLDALDLSSITHYMENNFVSKVTFSGVPILPPMMTRKRREEMLIYKRQACIAETRLKSMKREKMAQKAQSFVEDIQNTGKLQQSISSPPSGGKASLREGTSQPGSKPQSSPGHIESHSEKEKTWGQESNQLRTNEPPRKDGDDVTVTEDTGICTSNSSQSEGLLTESAAGSLGLEAAPTNCAEPSIPSFLESLSDYQSLDEIGRSLPTEYDGMPLTSTKQKQISQLLAKLSRELNIKDSLTSTSSSGNSETGTGMLSNTNPPGDITATNTLSDYSTLTATGGLYLHALNRDMSQDTLPELSTTVEDHVADESSSTIKSMTLGNLNDELSVEDKSTDSIRSPKSPKNTVHFASTVTEIYTDNKSGESSTLQKSLQSAASTPGSSVAPLTEAPSAETLLRHLKARRKEMLSSDAKPENVPVAAGPSPAELSQTDRESNVNVSDSASLLSKVVLSPDFEETSSSSTKDTPRLAGGTHVPFQSYAVEGETSDKENECITQESHSSPRINNEPESSFVDKESESDKKPGDNLSRKPQCNATQESSSREFQTSSPVSRPDSNLSRVSLHSLTMSADTETLCEQGSVQSNTVGDSVSTIRSFASTLEEQNDKNISDMNLPNARLKSGPQIMNILTEEETQCKPGRKESNIKDGEHKRSHARKGSYTLEVPSPALVRARSIQNVTTQQDSPQSNLSCDSASMRAATGQTKPARDMAALPAELPDNDQSSERIKRKLDYHELEEGCGAPNISQADLQAEQEGKQEHLNRYLDCVRQQSEEMGQSLRSGSVSTVQPAGHGQPGVPDFLDSYNFSSLSTLSLDQGRVTHMSQEELFDVQATHFDLLRKKLVEQQKLQLEHLFQQQQQEQLHLQKEIEERCRLIGEQQEFLGDQPPATRQRKIPKTTNQGKIAQDVNSEKAAQVYKSSDKSLGQTSSSYSYISSPSLVKHPSDKDNSFVSTFSRTTPKQYLFGNPSSPPQPTYQHHGKPVIRSPRRAPPPRSNRRLVVPDKANEAGMKQCYDRVSAGVKGYLTRRLLKTEKVQNLIKTVRDTREFALNFQSETPIKQGKFSMQDRDLLERIIAQLQAALLDIHEVFFEISASERMAMIAASRQLEMERRFKELEQGVDRSHPRVSMATLKAMERKRRAQAAEASVFGVSRPQSAPPPETSSPRQSRSIDHRALRPLQGHISPIHPSEEEPRSRSHKDRPRTAPDRVTVINTHRAAKGRKSSLTGAAAPEHRRPSKSLLVKAKPVSSTAAATVAPTKPSSKSKSGKAWR